MPIFEIQTPDGRTLDIEAADEATAISGAQSWVTENPNPVNHGMLGAAPQPASAAAPAQPGYQRELDRIQAERAKPHAPTIGEGALGLTPEQEAQESVKQSAAKRAEQEAYDSRTIGDRVGDTAAFAASLPVRMATKGDYGIADAAELVGERPEFADALRQREGSFAQNNQAGLEALKAVGDVTAGIPMLSTMGAVPGQMLRTSAAAVKQIPNDLRQLAGDTRGAATVAPPMPAAAPVAAAGGAVPPGGVPPVAATLPSGPRPPTNTEVIDAARRIEVPVMGAMVGNRVERELAGGLGPIVYAGTPLSNAFERGQQALSDAAARGVQSIGRPGVEAGEEANRSLVNWLKVGSKEQEKALYKDLGSTINPAVTRPLTATAKEVKDILGEMAESTSKTPQPALDIVEDALARPGGLTFRGKTQLRTDIGEKISEARMSGQGGTAIPAYRRLYGALTRDLEETARASGGSKAVDAFRRVNKEVEDLNLRREEVENLIGRKGQASEGQVINRIQNWASTQGSDLNRLRIVKRAMPEAQWRNAASEVANRWGIDQATGQWSHNRFMTAYGKLTDAGKAEILGDARSLFDDIATVSSKYKELEKLGNPSGTGRVNSVIKLVIENPIKAASGLTAGTAVLGAPMALMGGAATLGGFKAGRSLAWYLARDVTKSQARAGKLIKSYYGVESALKKGGEALVRNEEALDSSIRSFATGMAAETGQSAAEIEKSLRDAIAKIRKGSPSADASDAMGRALRGFGAVA